MSDLLENIKKRHENRSVLCLALNYYLLMTSHSILKFSYHLFVNSRVDS